MSRTAFSVAALLASLTLAGAPGALAQQEAPAAAPAAAPAPSLKESTLVDSLAKLLITTQIPDVARPWAPGKSNSTMGIGTCVKVDDKSYILVPSTAVAFASKIEGPGGVAFAVAAISPGAQLALLTPKENAAEFFKNHPGLELADAGAEFVFAGFNEQQSEPIGIPAQPTAMRVDGASLTGVASIKGLVPRTAYGPALAGGKVVGLFSGAQMQQDGKGGVATFVPISEIKLFLDDAADGTCQGKWGLKDDKVNFRQLINPALRAKLGVKADTHGLLVTGEAAAIAPFQSGDILTKIGTVAVDDEGAATIGTGTGSFKGGAFSAFYHINGQTKSEAKTLPVSVLRAGKSVDLEIPVTRRGNELMPSLADQGAQLRYFVAGPLCFEQATVELAQALVQRRGAELVLSGSPIGAHLNLNIRQSPDEEIVVLAALLPHDITKGYAGTGFPAVKAVNGQAVASLRQLAQLINGSKDEYLEFTFHDKAAETLIFKRSDLLAASEQICIDNGIVRKSSKDLTDIVK